MTEKYPRGPLLDEAKEGLSDALLPEMQNLLRQGKYLELITLYSENEKLITDNRRPEIHHVLALAYAALKMPEKAAQIWESEADQEIHEDQKLLGLGQAYLDMGQYEEAVGTFIKFREKFPEHLKVNEALLKQALAELALGREDEALQHLVQALEADPKLAEDPDNQSLLGNLFLKKGDTKKGIAALERATELLQDNDNEKLKRFLLYAHLGQAYTQSGLAEEADRAFQAALDLNLPNPLPETLFLIARAYKDLGREDKYREVLAILEKVNHAFWQEVAGEEIKALSPNEKVNQLLDNRETGAATEGNTPPPGAN